MRKIGRLTRAKEIRQSPGWCDCTTTEGLSIATASAQKKHEEMNSTIPVLCEVRIACVNLEGKCPGAVIPVMSWLPNF
eukprot:scaffold122291_cov27-Prasinocladus_malaysianus.AAC.1